MPRCETEEDRAGAPAHGILAQCATREHFSRRRTIAALVGLTLFLSVGLRPCFSQPPIVAPREQDEMNAFAAQAGDGFHVRRTDRFLIAYDTPLETVTPFLGRLEGTNGAVLRFLRVLPFETRPPEEPLRVILFRDFDGFARFANAAGIASTSLAGVYDPTRDLAAFCDTAALPQIVELRRKLDALAGAADRRARPGGSDIDAELISRRTQLDAMATQFNRFVVQHEAAHQTLFHAGLHVRGAMNPAWFVEGLACQFEIPQPDGAGRLLKVNHVRLADFHDALNVQPSAKSVTSLQTAAAVAGGRWLPLRDLLTGTERFAAPGENAAFTYAQAWALVFYLHRERQEGLAAYARVVSQRRPGEPIGAAREIEEFERAIGPVDAAFEESWVRYVLAQRLDLAEAGR